MFTINIPWAIKVLRLAVALILQQLKETTAADHLVSILLLIGLLLLQERGVIAAAAPAPVLVACAVPAMPFVNQRELPIRGSFARTRPLHLEPPPVALLIGTIFPLTDRADGGHERQRHTCHIPERHTCVRILIRRVPNAFCRTWNKSFGTIAIWVDP